jgi:hypothetical protein
VDAPARTIARTRVVGPAWVIDDHRRNGCSFIAHAESIKSALQCGKSECKIGTRLGWKGIASAVLGRKNAEAKFATEVSTFYKAHF